MSTSQSTHSTEFWYDDGNVVLHAEVGNVLFRVHRGILASKSAFFKDAFRKPPAADATLVDGCEVVVLKDDNLRDWEYVLGRIYNPFALTPLDQRPGMRGLLSMMHIGRKYGFDTMLRTAVHTLISHFVKFNIDIQLPFVGPMDTYKRSRYTGGDLFLAINAALEFNIEVILPGAYYLASFDEIYTAASARPDDKDDRFPDEREPVALSSQAQEAIIAGKQKLVTTILAFFRERLRQPFQPSSKCMQTSFEQGRYRLKSRLCAQAYTDTPESALASFCEEKLLGALHITDESPARKLFDGLCRLCAVEKGDIWRAESTGEIQKLWMGLPKIYGVAQSWEELKMVQPRKLVH